MNIIVCIKQTLDTEERIAVRDGTVETGADAKRIINPYDEFALEEALRLKERFGGTVTVMTIGSGAAEVAIRSAFAIGADEGVWIRDERLTEDEYTVSESLAAAIRSRMSVGKSFDLVLAGHMAIDSGASQGGPRLAELLGIPYVAAVTALDIDGVTVTARRDVEGDEETVEAVLPLLATAQQGLNEPRYPTLPGIMKAKKKPVETLGAEQLGLEAGISPKTKRTAAMKPPPKQAGRMLKGDPAAQADELVRLLQVEAKLL